MHFNAIWMIDFTKGYYFSLNCLSFHIVIQFGFFVNFDRELFLVFAMVANSDNGIGSLADNFSDLVFLHH